jgi:ABC-type lipoprotein release transport system permease subunit
VATRLALGATRGRVFWLMLRHGRTLTIVGSVIGLAAGYAAGRVVASRLYDVRAGDPMILGLAALIVTAIAVIATVIPAARAAMTSPSKVLRTE